MGAKFEFFNALFITQKDTPGRSLRQSILTHTSYHQALQRTGCCATTTCQKKPRIQSTSIQFHTYTSTEPPNSTIDSRCRARNRYPRYIAQPGASPLRTLSSI